MQCVCKYSALDAFGCWAAQAIVAGMLFAFVQRTGRLKSGGAGVVRDQFSRSSSDGNRTSICHTSNYSDRLKSSVHSMEIISEIACMEMKIVKSMYSVGLTE